MWEPDTSTHEMDAVIERTTVSGVSGKKTQSKVEAPASNDAAKKVQIAETPSAPALMQPKQSTDADQMNAPAPLSTTDDGSMMGDLSRIHRVANLVVSPSSADAPGFMDAADTDSQFTNEMNTVVKGLDMTATMND